MILKKLAPYVVAGGLGLAGLLGASTAKAEEPPTQTQTEQTPAYKNPLEWIIVGSEITASIFAATFIHETGHVAAAAGLGAKITEFHPYPAKIGSTWLAGYYSVDTRGLSKESKMFITGAGMLATRLTSEGLDTLINHTDMHPRINQGLAALYFMNRFEGPKYVLRTAIPAWFDKPGNPSNDVQNLMDYSTNRKAKKKPEEQRRITKRKVTKEEKAIYAGATALILIDTILDWDEIMDNLKRLWLIDSTKREQKKYDYGLEFLNGRVQANFTCRF